MASFNLFKSRKNIAPQYEAPQEPNAGIESLANMGPFDPEAAELAVQQAKAEAKAAQPPTLEELQTRYDLGNIEARLAAGESMSNILADVDRPVDQLVESYELHQLDEDREEMDTFDRACRTRLDIDFTKIDRKHYGRIMAYSIGDQDKHENPELINQGDYKKFVERYQTAADFWPVVEQFMAGISQKNTPAKIAEYTSDMNEFGKLLFGDQWELLKQINNK